MKRNLFIDTIRGLLLVIMLVDHTPLFIRRFTASSFGFFDGAEGFIFISAYLFGLIYSKHLNNSNLLFEKTVKRVWLIYKYHIVSVVVLHLLVFGIIFYSPRILSIDKFEMEEITVIYILKTLFILKQASFLDILPLYMILISLSPLILLGFKYNFKITLLISFVLWGLIQFPYSHNLYDRVLSKFDISFGSFNIFGWQFLFTIGLFLGFRTYHKKNQINYNPKIVSIIFIVAFALFILRHSLYKFNDELFWILIGNKEYLQPVRLFNFLLVLYIFGYINKNYSVTRMNFLSYIGKYSIDVFTFHLLIIYLININSNVGYLSKPMQLVLGFLIVSSLIIPAILKEKYNVKSKNKESPSVLSRLVLIISLPQQIFRLIKNILRNLLKRNKYLLQRILIKINKHY